MRRMVAAVVLVAACGGGGAPDVVVHLGADSEVQLPGGGARELTIVNDEAQAIVVEVWSDAGWVRPVPVEDELTVEVAGEAFIWSRGFVPPPVRRERSLVWTDPLVVDDPAVVGLGRVMRAIADDGHGGELLDQWFRRFATTAHSERAAPAMLMDELAATHGPPSTWDLDALPFVVTGVHNRLDLATRSGGCGELRVSIASTHPVYAPLHVIFLFRQPPHAEDATPDGVLHCLHSARVWARVSDTDGAAFVQQADSLLGRSVVREHFLLAESVELTVSPWEWRQWDLTTLENPPLFQTVDTPALNQPGAQRDDFLAWAWANEAGLRARTVEIPARFRSPSARVTQGVPREPLDVGDAALAADIEIVGCPACHTSDAEFVQTSVQRTFSPFYDRELDARAARIDLMNAGADVGTPPFGPLQAE